MWTCFKIGKCFCQDPEVKVHPGDCWRKRKKQVIIQIPEVSQHPWEARAMKPHGSWGKSPTISKAPTVCSVRTGYDITWRKVTLCFLWCNEERGHGLNEIWWIQAREGGPEDLFSLPYSSTDIIPEVWRRCWVEKRKGRGWCRKGIGFLLVAETKALSVVNNRN